MKRTRLTPAELELMNILWDHGPSTVQAVVDHLPPGRDLAYTTVQTVLNTLHAKGQVRRALASRAYRYEAAVSRERAAGRALKDLIRGLFGGSPEELVLAMVRTRQLTPQQLRDLQREIDGAAQDRSRRNE